VAEGRRQVAEGRRQKAGGRRIQKSCLFKNYQIRTLKIEKYLLKMVWQ
jgi:hypothetical protein